MNKADISMTFATIEGRDKFLEHFFPNATMCLGGPGLFHMKDQGVRVFTVFCEEVTIYLGEPDGPCEICPWGGDS